MGGVCFKTPTHWKFFSLEKTSHLIVCNQEQAGGVGGGVADK